MDAAPDADLLAFAGERGFVLVSKDSDFFDPGVVRGNTAKIVWIRRGNCSTTDIEAILRRHADDVSHLEATERLSLLMLY